MSPIRRLATPTLQRSKSEGDQVTEAVAELLGKIGGEAVGRRERRRTVVVPVAMAVRVEVGVHSELIQLYDGL